jgi:ABC-type nitrate/sulfonate/bicarbonate transport system substrate-binding protein
MTQISRRDFLKISAITSASLVGSGFLASCDAQEATTVEKLDFQLNWIKNVEFAGMWWAQKQGYYADEKVDANFLAGGSGVDPIAAVAAGSALAGFGSNGAAVCLALAEEVPLKIIASQFQANPGALVTKASAGIRTAEDIRGKRIGLQQTARPSIEIILRVNNIPVEEVELIPVTFDITPIMTDQVDLMVVFATNQPLMMREQGVEPYVLLYSDLGYPMAGAPMLVTEETLDTKKDLLVRFLRATIRGWDDAIKNQEEVVNYVVDEIGEGLNLNQQMAEMEAQIPLMQSPLTEQNCLFWLDGDVWEKTNNLVAEAGMISEPVDLDKALTWEILEQACP